MKATALFLLGLTACIVAGPDEPQMNPAMAGAWVGTSTLRADVLPALSGTRPSRLVVTLDGPRVSVSGLCLDGRGAIFQALGEGNVASWDGAILGCNAVQLADGCPVQVAYSAISIELGADGALRVIASGTVSGCGVDPTSPAIDTFIGAR